MERWEALIEGYPPAPTLRDFSKAVESAKVVLKEDLAPFEIEWLLQTFLSIPVNALAILSSHYHEDAWSNVSGRCLELLMSLVTNHTSHLQVYMEEIVKRCTHQYSVHVRRRALQCLAAAAARAPACAIARVFARVLDALGADEPVTARVARAQLVGTLCEYHPELLASEKEIEIWRVYLTILEASKTTDSLINGALLGLNGLFKHFGVNLPTSELNSFYDKLSSKYLLMESCQEASLQLLSNYPHLFPERVAADLTLRARLWRIVTCAGAADALKSVYGVSVREDNVQNIITTEVYPRTVSKIPQESDTANCILSTILRKHTDNSLADIRRAFGKQVSSLCTALEFALAAKVDTAPLDEKWEYDHNLASLVQQASWCIETGQAGCDALLRSVLLLYPQVAPARRRKLVVHTLLYAADGLRTAAVTFLISDSCAAQELRPLWRDLFDGSDPLVARKSRLVFGDVTGYAVFVLGAFAEGRLEENARDRLSSLMLFLSQMTEIEIVRDYLADYVETLLGLTLDCSAKYGLSEGLVRFVASLLSVADEACMFEDGSLSEELVGDLKRFYQCLRIDRCRDEALLCASCLALTRAPAGVGDAPARLQALQVIFSRADVDAATLSQALRNFENLLSDDTSNGFEPIIADIISKVSQLSSKKDLSSKAGRVLRRDVLMFLGKYDDRSAHCNPSDSSVTKLRDLLVLSLPNVLDGTSLKINLKRTLDLALTHEDPKALHSLLLILCTNLASKQDPLLHEALTLVIYKLSRCHGRGETEASSLEQAVSFCRTVDCVRSLVQYVTSERSPGVRKILSNILETLLSLDAHSETTERSLTVVIEQAGLMMASDSSITKRAGLDLVETIITALKENDKLSVDYVPNLLVSILKTDEKDFEIAYELASAHFLEKLVLYKEDALQNLAKKLIESVNAICDEMNLKLAIEACMATFKEICVSAKWHSSQKFLEMFTQIFEEQGLDIMAKVRYLLLLTKSKETLEFDAETSRRVASMNDFMLFKIVKELLDVKGDIYRDTVLRTLGVYAEVSLEVKYVMTIEYLGLAIVKLSPKFIKTHHKTIEKCLKTYQRLWTNPPQGIVNSFETFCEKLPIKTITENIEKRMFVHRQAVIIYSMKKLFEIINLSKITSILLESRDFIKKWPKILLHSFASSYDSTDLFKSKMADLSDILTVSLHFLTAEEVTEIILEGWQLRGMSNEKIGFKFCQYFMNAFAPYLLANECLLREELKCAAMLVHDLIKWCSKNDAEEDVRVNILGLVEQLWSTLATTHSFNDLHSILTDLSTITPPGLMLDSTPGRWWLASMTGSDEDERVRLMAALPVLLQDGVAEGCREEYFSALLGYSNHIPRRLQSTSAADPHLLALLHAVSRTGEVKLLELLITCVAHDSTPPWLDASLQNAMAVLAIKQDVAILKAVYTLCDKDELSTGLYERVLVPLVRNSPAPVCVDLFSHALPRALSALWRRTRSSPPPRAHVCALARAHVLCALAFEKLPLSELQSPSSRLYSKLELKQSATLAQELCKLCATLRTEVQCPEDAGDELRSSIRWFQTSNFNCLATVLCRTRPGAKFYASLLRPSVLAALVDTQRPYRLYIQPQGRVPTALVASPEAGGDSPLTCRGTALARTLSDNPLAYDFLSVQVEEQAPPQTMALPDTELNAHPCAATLTTAIRQLSALAARMEKLEAVFHDDSLHCYVKWFVTQMVLNCKQDLTEHSAYLTPALLHVVATTPYETQGKKLLNGLHVNVLNTISQWTEEAKEKPALTQADRDHIQTIFELLLATCVHHRSRHYVFKTCMNTLHGFLKLYGEMLHGKWTFFEEALKDKSNETACLEILIAVTKNKIHIPELLDKVLAKLESKQSLANKLAGTAELYGLALAASRSTDLSKFWKVLERLRSTNSQDYVKLLFYAQNGSKECCNEINFRHIADLTPKMLREQRSKCFEVLSGFVSRLAAARDHVSDMFDSVDICESLAAGEHRIHALKLAKNGLRVMPDGLKRRVVFLACDVCSDSAAKVRKAAVDVVLEAFLELFAPASTEPPFKRPRTQPTSKLLTLLAGDDVYGRTVVSTIGRGLVDRDEMVRSAVESGVGGVLADDDLIVRFCEVLLVTVTLPGLQPAPSAGQSPADAAGALAVMLRLLFQGLTGTEAFRRLRLREEPLEVIGTSSAIGPSKLLTMSRTYQGTFRARFTGTGRNKASKAKTNQTSCLNVQVPLADVLDSFLQFCQSSLEVATSFFLDTVRALQRLESGEDTTLGQSADSALNTNVASQLSKVLEKGHVNHLTPVVLQLCRLCVNECCAVDSFKSSVLKVKTLTARTNGEGVSSLLYEDLVMREGHGIGALGADMPGDDGDDDEEMGVEYREFSIEGLESTFGRLSNWDQLTLREKRYVESSTLSPLWTDDAGFREALEGHQATTEWLSKMQQSLGPQGTGDQYRWLRQLDHWPAKPFAVSAITEALEWHCAATAADVEKLPCSIKSADCLAEWAARLLMRSTYLSTAVSDSESDSDSLARRVRSQRLAWCSEASRRGVPGLVLQCVKLNAQDLHENEALSWLHQQALALRGIGLKRRNDELLQKALLKTETFTEAYRQHSTPHTLLSMDKLKLQLNRDLESLTTDKIDAILDDAWGQKDSVLKDKVYGTENRRNLVTMCEIAMCYYDESWEQNGDVTEQHQTISQMSACLSRVSDLNSASTVEAFTAILLSKLDQYSEDQLPDDLADDLLRKLDPLTDSLNDFLIQELARLQRRFPGQALARSKLRAKISADALSVPKLRLQLVCDPEYTLRQYVEDLAQWLDKGEQDAWAATFKRMEELLDNPHAGTAFQLLAKHRPALNEIKNYEISKEYQTNARQSLRSILSQLSASEDKVALSLAQLCPALAGYSLCEGEKEAGSLADLLGLKDGVRVVRFEKQVRVIAGSIRRPCVLRALLSDGRSRRVLLKRGEPLRLDAAATTAQRMFNDRSMAAGSEARSYNVTPLSDDCALIEYLEDHVTLRSMIPKASKILSTIRRPADSELILASSASTMKQFEEICQKVPAYTLRSTMEENSLSMQDFLQKRQRFTGSLSAMTICHWLLGVGDRHLENCLCDVHSGAALAIDWGSALRHCLASRQPELAPARLTRSLLAVGGVHTVLESRLESILTALRSSYRLIMPLLKVLFRWMPDYESDGAKKMTYIEDILRGRALSYHITRGVLEDSDHIQNADKYIELLDGIFEGYPVKERYDVEDQVSCLLRQCTEPRILSITRSGWEPWL